MDLSSNFGGHSLPKVKRQCGTLMNIQALATVASPLLLRSSDDRPQAHLLAVKPAVALTTYLIEMRAKLFQ